MSNEESLVVRAQPSALKATLLGVAFIPACVVLAMVQCFALSVAGEPFDEIQDVAVLTILNAAPLAIILLACVRLDLRWFSVSAAAVAIVAGAVLSLMALGPRSAVPTSAQLGPEVLPELRPLQRPDVPLAPSSSRPVIPPPVQNAPAVGDSLPKSSTGGDSVRADLPAAPPVALPQMAPPRPPARPDVPLAPTASPPASLPPTANAPAAPPSVAPPQMAPRWPKASIRPFSVDRPTAEFSLPKAGDGESGPPIPMPPSAPAPGSEPAAAATDAPASPRDSGGAGGGGGGTGGGRLGKFSGPMKIAKAKSHLRIDEGGRLDPGAIEPPFGSGRPITDAPPPTRPARPDAAMSPSAYWNTWFAGGTGPAANILIANNTYTYSLDLSAFDYTALRKAAQSSTTKADDRLKDIIADLSVPEIILNIKPMVPEGSGLRIVDSAASFTMKVDLRKIRKPNAAAAQQFADGAMEIEEFSRQVSAGSIQIPVFAESNGCATIAFAIFKGLLPLDHLVQRVSIGGDAASAPVCDSDDPTHRNALSGGLDTLREVALGMEGSGASVTAAAALHVFDFASYSMAVFVDGRPGKSQSVYGWQTASSVVDYLKTDNFQNLVRKARKDAANNKPGSYVHAAQEMAKVLFSTKPGNPTEFEARNAEAAFRSVVNESATAAVIVVRVASSLLDGQNRSIYVPLGILGAKGPGAVLDKPIIVVQPMAIERYPSRDKCIGDWTFAVPNALENVPAAIMSFPAKFPGQRIDGMDKLREYLASDPTGAVPLVGPLPSPRTVGFVVLAHQDEGFLWFAESGDRIIAQDIEKRFPAGSVGIFAACSAASAKGRNAALLQRLNEQGIDTMIASPFTIDAGYGVVFASSFAEVVGETVAGGERPTILKLFDLTIERTAQKFKDKTNGEYGELGLEYVLLGNPAITLCPP